MRRDRNDANLAEDIVVGKVIGSYRDGKDRVISAIKIVEDNAAPATAVQVKKTP